MGLLTTREWNVAEAIAGIGHVNPFLPERIELEKRALGKEFVPFRPFLQYRPDCSVSDMFPNAPRLSMRGGQLLEKMRTKLIAGEPATDRELEAYENLALFILYARYMSTIIDLPIARFRNRPEDDILGSYDAFVADYEYFFHLPQRTLPSQLDRDIIFAGLFQIERAFFHIFNHIVGGSLAAANLRAGIWQSIFTHDMNRYLRCLYRYMGDITTLITGPSGTGKELVAMSIAFSQFVRFDGRNRQFATDYTQSFHGLNLTAVTSTLIESELFGHAKGAFTGAAKDRHGYLDESVCDQWGTVFLDEVGDLDAQIQVKLLRVLQTREFHRIGDPQSRKFVGKIVAATNRDLAAEMEAGRFREDFYYRLCADRIETPSLQAQLRDAPEDLANFVRFIARRLLPEIPDEADRLTDDVTRWVNEHLGQDYSWPGNIRELEQCVRSIMIRGSYTPTERRRVSQNSATEEFASKVKYGDLTKDEMIAAYYSLKYAQLGSYGEAGRQLGVDWRTVKEQIDEDLVKRFAAEVA